MRYLSSSLRPGDDLVGGGRQHKIHPTRLVGFKCGGKIEVGKQNFLGPITIRPVGTGGIERRSDDGVTGNLLAAPIVKHEHRGWELVVRLSRPWLAVRGSSSRRIDLIARQAHKTIALQFDEQGICGFHFLSRGGWNLLHNNRGRLLNDYLLSIIGIPIVPPETVSPKRREKTVAAETKTTMVKTSHDARPHWPDAVAGTESSVTDGTAHVGAAGYTHPPSGNLSQQRGCCSQQYEN